MTRTSPVLLVAAVGLFGIAPALVSTYDEHRAAAVKKCDAIDPAAYQTGLYFNPDGYRSFYLRSECFQDAAVRFRDAALCARVIERRSLLASSWGYSAAHCRETVSGGIAEDRRALEAMKTEYVAGHMVLRDFRVEPNGNGRDFEFIPLVAGQHGHGYALQIEIVSSERTRPPVLIHASSYFVDGTSNLRIYLRSDEIQRRMADFAAGRRYTVRATMTFTVPPGTLAAEWSDAFVDGVFPASARTQSITRDVEWAARSVPGADR